METQNVKVVVVGDSGVGKTCLVIRLMTGHFPVSYVPTIYDFEDGNSLSVDIQINHSTHFLQLQIWDTFGPEDYDAMRPLSYVGADVVLLCFQMNDLESLQNVWWKWGPELQHHLPTVPQLLIGLNHKDHELVFGFVRQMRFRNKLNISDDILHIILRFEYGTVQTGQSLTADQILDVQKKCICEEYLEVDARTGQNIDELLSLTSKVAIRGISRNERKKYRRPACIML